jgi:NAD(P)-dependent dehydrogenase (short-subunit alcohol dehydrogenase family)
MGTPSPDQRTAVVTGAAGGLGLAVAELLLERGTQVSMVDVDAQRLSEASDRLRGEPQALLADLSRTAECDRVIAEAEMHWGRIDILVNCAAIVHRVDLFELDEATFSRIIDTNLRSVFWLCRGVIPGMEERRWGRIVNLTSVGVHTGGYRLTSAVYEATKAGVGNLTKTLARALASNGILVNSVAPGAMRTRMILDETPADVLEEVARDIPLGRLGEPLEVAEVVVFLASDRNTYVTGATFDANGGLIMA